jgi:hypothetical protein
MKTTIDIPEPLLHQARERAARDGTTLRALVEKGLRQVLAEKPEAEPFNLKQVTFGGDGTVSALNRDDWDNIRDRAYGEWPDDRG